MTTEPIRRVDVRPLIDQGLEPFPEIMKARAELKAGETLLLISPFEPRPLYKVFENEGFRITSTLKGPDEWHTAFVPGDPASQADATIDLDLRMLEPPDPLHKTLEATARLRRGQTLRIRTRFRPVHLFEELDGNGFDWDSEEAAPFDWVSHIWRVPQQPND